MYHKGNVTKKSTCMYSISQYLKFTPKLNSNVPLQKSWPALFRYVYLRQDWQNSAFFIFYFILGWTVPLRLVVSLEQRMHAGLTECEPTTIHLSQSGSGPEDRTTDDYNWPQMSLRKFVSRWLHVSISSPDHLTCSLAGEWTGHALRSNSNYQWGAPEQAT